MSSTPIDLSRLPPPDIVHEIDFEAALAERKAGVIALLPENLREQAAAALALESEPVTILLQESVYREIYRAAIENEDARGAMLAFARKGTLDHIGALFDVQRKELQPENPETGAPAVMEEDDDFRARIQLAPQSYSVAGPEGAYRARALAAHPDVLDASATSPEPGVVLVKVLSRYGDGTPGEEVIDAVRAALCPDDVRPLTDWVKVEPAEIVRYAIRAVIRTFPGPDSSVVETEADDNINAYRARTRRLGQMVAHSGLDAAMHVEGVKEVVIIEPAESVVVTKTQSAWCAPEDVDIRMEVADDD